MATKQENKKEEIKDVEMKDVEEKKEVKVQVSPHVALVTGFFFKKKEIL